MIFYVNVVNCPSYGSLCYKRDIKAMLREYGYQIYTEPSLQMPFWKIDTVSKNVFASKTAVNPYGEKTGFDVIRRLL